ncbi:MAG TPA: hypothetical protein VGN34_22375, partial [Ktedonobacteraceae bacterium]
MIMIVFEIAQARPFVRQPWDLRPHAPAQRSRIDPATAGIPLGSGTNEQDRVDAKSQSVLKMRSLSWSQ